MSRTLLAALAGLTLAAGGAGVAQSQTPAKAAADPTAGKYGIQCNGLSTAKPQTDGRYGIQCNLHPAKAAAPDPAKGKYGILCNDRAARSGAGDPPPKIPEAPK